MGKSKEKYMEELLHEDFEREYMRDKLYIEEMQHFFDEEVDKTTKTDESNYRDKQNYRKDLPF